MYRISRSSSNSGRVTSVTDARGVTVDYTYGADGRLAALKHRGSTESISYTYDILGRKHTMTDSTGTTTWAYTATSQAKQIDTPEGTVSYNYDNSGLRTKMTQPQGSLSYAYNDAGQLSTLTDWTGGITRTNYDADNNLTSLTRPNEVTTAYRYDQAGRLTSLISKHGSDVVDRAEYTLDANGNRTSLTNTDGTDHYTLNNLNQLTDVTYSNGTTQTYTYDATGNRTSLRQGAAAPVTYTYDDASQLTSIGGTPVAHDASGNTTANGTDTYTWDWLGRLQTVTTGGSTTSYATDGDGYRTSRNTSAGTDTLLYDRTANAAGQTLISSGDTGYLSIDGMPIAQLSSSKKGYATTDALNSATTWTDQDGTVIGRTSYAAFGDVRSSTGETSTTVGYTGASQDGDLVHLGLRELNSATGAFLSTDAVSPGAPGVAGWNPYTYVANNPTTLTDPTGAFAVGEYGLLVQERAKQTAPAAAETGIATSEMFRLGVRALVRCALTCEYPAPAPTSPAPPRTTPTRPSPQPTPSPVQVPVPQPQPEGPPMPSQPSQDEDNFCRAFGLNDGEYDYFPLRDLDRATGARACILPGAASDGLKASTPAPFHSVGPYQRGHLIAKQLGGASRDLRNLTWQTQNANNSQMRSLVENRARDELNLGNRVYYQVWVDWSLPRVVDPWVSAGVWVGFISSSGISPTGPVFVPNA